MKDFKDLERLIYENIDSDDDRHVVIMSNTKIFKEFYKYLMETTSHINNFSMGFTPLVFTVNGVLKDVVIIHHKYVIDLIKLSFDSDDDRSEYVAYISHLIKTHK